MRVLRPNRINQTQPSWSCLSLSLTLMGEVPVIRSIQERPVVKKHCDLLSLNTSACIRNNKSIFLHKLSIVTNLVNLKLKPRYNLNFHYFF